MAGSVLIVVPCYNESDRLAADRFRDYVARETGVKFLFVDDGSTDGTFDRLRELRAAAPRSFDLLRLEKNAGKGEAVRRGLQKAFAEGAGYAGFWDADLSTPLAPIRDFHRLLEERPALEAVFGARVNLLGRRIERRPLRHYLGRLFATAADALTGIPVYDSQCGAKLFRVSDRIKEAFARPFLSRWIFDMEILARLAQAGAPVREIIYEYPLPEWRDVKGSKIRPWEFIRAGLEILAVYKKYGLDRQGKVR